MNGLLFTTSDFTAAPTVSAGKMAQWVSTKLARKLEKLPTLLVFGEQIGLQEGRLFEIKAILVREVEQK